MTYQRYLLCRGGVAPLPPTSWSPRDLVAVVRHHPGVDMVAVVAVVVVAVVVCVRNVCTGSRRRLRRPPSLRASCVGPRDAD